MTMPHPMPILTVVDKITAFSSDLMRLVRVPCTAKEGMTVRRYSDDNSMASSSTPAVPSKAPGGEAQYKAYCKYAGQNPSIRESHGTNARFGVGEADGIGIAALSFPVGPVLLTIDILVVDADVPILLSLADMDRLHISYNNLDDKLTHAPDRNLRYCETTVWAPFSTVEQIHVLHVHRIGTPPASSATSGTPVQGKLFNLLKRA